MKKIICFFLLIAGLCAFIPSDDGGLRTRITQNMILRLKGQPQEKMYLHTDRDYYNVEEKIWFRAYVTDAATHKMSDYSRYVYVELVDRQDSIYRRIKVGWRDSVFAGYIPIPKDIQQGEYFLRAYTYWMQNLGEDYIFKKKIRLLNPQDTRVVSDVTYTEEGKAYYADVRLSNSRKESYNKVFVNYSVNGREKIARTDEDGRFRVKLDTSGKVEKFRISFQEEQPFHFSRYIYVPSRKKEIDLQFFPEGGNLLTGVNQTVAFKAVGPDGLSAEVSGYVCDEDNKFVMALKSLHKGMGAFGMVAEKGKKYYAMLSFGDTTAQKVALPEPRNDAIGLQVRILDTLLVHSLMLADSAVLPDNLHILVHSRGVPLACVPVGTVLAGKIPLRFLPDGILHFVLIDAEYRVYSERLCFVRKKERPQLSVGTDKSHYVSREQVNVKLNVGDAEIRSGSFSVAVTDDVAYDRDSLVDNIMSDLLLTSDLKGYVEDPGYYFRRPNRMTDRFLDLLMRTQGWTRFDVPKIARGSFDEMSYYLEKGQAISGKIKNFWGKDALGANLILLGSNGLFKMVEADSTGNFMVDGIAFPDSVKFVVQAKSQKGKKSVEVIVDRDKFMPPAIHFPYNEETLSDEEDFYKKFGKDYYYDNGVKVYVLDEAVVRRKKAAKMYTMYDNMADYSLDSAKLASYGDMDIKDVLQQIPGIYVDQDKITRFSKDINVRVNDFTEELSYVLMLRPAELLSVIYLDGIKAAMYFGSEAENGVLLLTTIPGFVPRNDSRPNMAVFSLLGYQKRATFYEPKYGVDSVRTALANVSDARTTIYWNSRVQTDASGNAVFSFYTADSYGPYTVIVEGILNDGTVCRREEKISLKLP